LAGLTEYSPTGTLALAFQISFGTGGSSAVIATMSTAKQVMVRAVGIEPTLCHQNWILSPARLPVPPRPQVFTEGLLCALHLYCT
jgi:hypothetical protein